MGSPYSWSATSTFSESTSSSSRLDFCALSSRSSSGECPPCTERFARAMWFFDCFCMRSYSSCACVSRSRSFARLRFTSAGRFLSSVTPGRAGVGGERARGGREGVGGWGWGGRRGAAAWCGGAEEPRTFEEGVEVADLRRPRRLIVLRRRRLRRRHRRLARHRDAFGAPRCAPRCARGENPAYNAQTRGQLSRDLGTCRITPSRSQRCRRRGALQAGAPGKRSSPPFPPVPELLWCCPQRLVRLRL